MRESVLERHVPLVQVLLASCWLCRRNKAIEDSDESMNMLNIDIDASKDYATLHCHGVLSKLKKRGVLRSSPFHLGRCRTLCQAPPFSKSRRQQDVLSFMAPVLICILFATLSMANPQNFRIPRPHIFYSSLGTGDGKDSKHKYPGS